MLINDLGKQMNVPVRILSNSLHKVSLLWVVEVTFQVFYLNIQCFGFSVGEFLHCYHVFEFVVNGVCVHSRILKGTQEFITLSFLSIVVREVDVSVYV